MNAVKEKLIIDMIDARIQNIRNNSMEEEWMADVMNFGWIGFDQLRDKPRPSELVAQQPLGEAAEFGRGRIARTASPSLLLLLMWCLLLLDVLANDADRSAATR